MRSLLIIIVLAGLGVGGWFYWKKSGKTGSAPDPVADRPKSAVAETRDIRFAVTAAGEIGPAEQVSVRPEVNGKIAELPVDIGDSVKKGQLLFRLDDEDLQIEKSSQEKEIERTNLQLVQAERNHMRSKQLYDEKLVSQELYEDTRTLYELAKNALARAEKTLELVNERLSKARILAPFDCTILTRPVSMGQAVSGSGGFNSGTEVLTIADLNQLVINAHINQADVIRLKQNQVVEVDIEAVPGLRVKGEVERIAPQAIIKNNIKGFSARIILREVDPRIKPSMTANITIPVSSAENVLSVPLAAVFTEYNPDSKRTERFVYVKKDDDYERRDVQVGVSDFFNAEVQTGLTAGEEVALEKPEGVGTKPGAPTPPGAPAGGPRGTSAAPAGRPGAGTGQGGVPAPKPTGPITPARPAGAS